MLTRRLIEARIVAPLLSAMAAEFGAEPVHRIARDGITAIARQQGNELAAHSGGRSLPVLHGTLDRWTANDALTLDVHEVSESSLSFDVTRCRYAEMYREMGIPELGAILSGATPQHSTAHSMALESRSSTPRTGAHRRR